jgi:hypothetical protein
MTYMLSCPGYYPLLIALYKHLSIPLIPTFYTFSFSRVPGSTYFIYSGASGRSIPAFPSDSYRSPLHLLQAVLRLLETALCYILLIALALLAWFDLLPRPLDNHNTLREFTDHVAAFLASPIRSIRTPMGRVWTRFVEEVIIPLFGAVGTMTSSDIWATPVGYLLEYVHTTVGTAHYTLPPGTGAAEVAEKLARTVREQGEGYLRLGEEITGMEYEEDGVSVRSVNGDIKVDRVVLATQASSARALLAMLEESLAKHGEVVERKLVRRLMRGLEAVEYRVSELGTALLRHS